MKVGIIVGSVREGRAGLEVAQWVQNRADVRGDAEYAIIDLKEFDVPMLTSATLPMMANKSYESPAVQRWSDAVDGCDAYIFVTPEYNHSVPGAFKNAVDSLGSEWSGKAVAFAGYGADGAVRATEHWRQITANFSMVDVRAQLSLQRFAEWGEGGFTPNERREDELNTLLDQLVEMTRRMNSSQA